MADSLVIYLGEVFLPLGNFYTIPTSRSLTVTGLSNLDATLVRPTCKQLTVYSLWIIEGYGITSWGLRKLHYLINRFKQLKNTCVCL